ncbi:MAG TPA: hypothetical protein VKQ52_02115 [Puia sp.]|nr:hypothetical protein [Puia sp.]
MRTPSALLAAIALPAALALLPAASATAQPANHTLAAFSIWKPKEGQAALFEAGYKRHLQWHVSAGDRWNWYAWFILSGPRSGQFVDATFGHAWADLDHRVDPAGDGADNSLHTEPFAEFLTGYKLIRLPFSDVEDSTLLGTRYMRMLTIDVSNAAAATTIIAAAAAALRQKLPGQKLLAYEKLDGGGLGQLVLLLGVNTWDDYGKLAGWQDELSDIDHRNARPVITAITAETLVFRRDMSEPKN